MVAPRLVLILGDQLTAGIAALRAAKKMRDAVMMAEVIDEGNLPMPQAVAAEPRRKTTCETPGTCSDKPNPLFEAPTSSFDFL